MVDITERLNTKIGYHGIQGTPVRAGKAGSCELTPAVQLYDDYAQHTLDVLDRACARWGMQISVSKTKDSHSGRANIRDHSAIAKGLYKHLTKWRHSLSWAVRQVRVLRKGKK